MRKLIVKFTALNYIVKIFGANIQFPRISTIIVPLMWVLGVYMAKTETFFYNSAIGYVLFSLLLVAFFIGFIYYRFFPVKWHELTNSQKWQYGSIAYMSDKELHQWMKLNIKIKAWRKQKGFANVLPLLVHLLVTGVSVVVLLA